MKTILTVLSLAAVLSAHLPVMAQYRNPIINADVPDMSVCRAGDHFYMISTTMHLMPGAPIMRSADMQHWETIGYVYPRIDDGPRYSLLGDSTAYGQGQWASSIRYHDGLFYVWFTANGTPGRGFVYTAKNPAGPWTLLSRPPHHHDASLLFDDDGRVYLFHGTGQPRIRELKPDLSDVMPGGLDCQLFERDDDEQGLLEGSSVIKHNGKYYVLMISMDWGIPGRLRREVCYRADSIAGPYEKRIILETEFEGYGGVGQGCIVDGSDGLWHGLIFQDRGGIGRVPCLMPCTWTADGWPMLGDAQGRIPNDTSLPYTSLRGICGPDDFSSPELSLYWQWNHNPDDSAWSLTERPGWLRLTTARVVDNLYLAPNTLTQRMAGPRCSGAVTLDVSRMKDGDRCGLAAFNGHTGMIVIEREAGDYYISMQTAVVNLSAATKAVESVDTLVCGRTRLDTGATVSLRIDADFTGKRDLATFFYRSPGGEWKPIGRPFKMIFDYTRLFMGTRFAIFNYATRQTGGWVDVDSFDYSFDDGV